MLFIFITRITQPIHPFRGAALKNIWVFGNRGVDYMHSCVHRCRSYRTFFIFLIVIPMVVIHVLYHIFKMIGAAHE